MIRLALAALALGGIMTILLFTQSHAAETPSAQKIIDHYCQARMQGIAQPGEGLISEKTCQHVKDMVTVTELDTISFKGKNTVVAVYRVDGLLDNE